MFDKVNCINDFLNCSWRFNAISAGQNQNFLGLDHSPFMSVNPALVMSFNPSLLSQAVGFSQFVQSPLGSVGSYGVHPSLGLMGLSMAMLEGEMQLRKHMVVIKEVLNCQKKKIIYLVLNEISST